MRTILLLVVALALSGVGAISAGGTTPRPNAPFGVGGAVPASPAGAADLDQVLLDRFRPAVYFIDDVGPDGARVDYPCSYVADDFEIENNFAQLTASLPRLCYGRVHEQWDANGKTCWVVEYDYYYPRNWSKLPPPSGCFTHEHDWEWIYIVVGLDGETYRPYCACFSGHTGTNPELFNSDGKVRLFPGVAGGSVWRTAWDQRPEWAPRVSLGWEEHVEATALASGNAFDGSPSQPRSTTYWSHYDVRAPESLASSCNAGGQFCFGDPDLWFFCLGRSGLGECDDPRDPPWIRDGLGEQSPLPSGFALPEDWEENPSTETPTRNAGDRMARMGRNPCRGRLEVAFAAGPPPGLLELHDVSGRMVRRLPSERLSIDGSWNTFNLQDLSSGLYLLRARWPGEEEEVLRVVLLP